MFPTPLSEQVTRHRLEAQALHLGRALRARQVKARVAGSADAPRQIQYRLKLSPGQDTDELAQALKVSGVRVHQQGEVLEVEVPGTSEEPLRLTELLQLAGHQIPALTTVLGVADNGRPLLLRLPSADAAHALVAGPPGSGKTSLLNVIGASLAWRNPQRNLQLVLLDSTGSGLQPLTSLPHCQEQLVVDCNDAANWLNYLTDLAEHRHIQGTRSPRIVVLIDELDALLKQGGNLISTLLVRLSRRGREAGIHLICSVYEYSAELMGPLLNANFPVRLVGQMDLEDKARMAAGIEETSAGDFLAVAGGEVIRFQVPAVPDGEVEAINQVVRQSSVVDYRWQETQRRNGRAEWRRTE